MIDYKAKIHSSREEWIPSGSLRFLVRRPGDLTVAQLKERNEDRIDFMVALVRTAIVSWDNVTEAVLAPGGGDQPVAFDSEAFMVWIEDQEDHWNTVLSGVLDAISRHRARKVEAKNA